MKPTPVMMMIGICALSILTVWRFLVSATPTTSSPPSQQTIIFDSPHNHMLFNNYGDQHRVTRCPLITRPCVFVRKETRTATANLYYLPTYEYHNLPVPDHGIHIGVSPEPSGYYPKLADSKWMSQFHHVFTYGPNGPTNTNIPFGPFAWNGGAKPGGLVSTSYTAELIWPDVLPPVKPNKTRTVSWFAGNCNARNKRERLVAKLMTFIKVESFGGCLNNAKAPFGRGTAYYAKHDGLKTAFISDFVFDLSLENSISPHYISEKVWQPLTTGTIPVYLGTRDVFDVLPAKEAIVFVGDFKTVKDLADYLLLLMANSTLRYEKHLQWRDRPKETWSTGFWDLYNHSKAIHYTTNLDCLICQVAEQAAITTIKKKATPLGRGQDNKMMYYN